MKLAWI